MMLICGFENMFNKIRKYAKKYIPRRILEIILKIIGRGLRSKPRFGIKLNNCDDTINAIIAYNKNGGYCVPKTAIKRTVAQEILHGRVYEPDTAEYILSSIPRGDIVHAGAYFGDTLPVLDKSRVDGEYVFAFEPCVESYCCAKITCIINNLTKVKLFQKGVGAKKTTSKLLTIDPVSGLELGGTARIVFDNNVKFNCYDDVSLVKLDDVLHEDRKIAAIHLDVEGFEEDALNGALDTIQRDKPILILETVPSNFWFNKYLAPMGYRQVQKLDPREKFGKYLNTVYST